MLVENFDKIEASADFLEQLKKQIKPQIESYCDYVFAPKELRITLEFDGYNTNDRKKHKERKYIFHYEGHISKIIVNAKFLEQPYSFQLGVAWVDPYHRHGIVPRDYSKRDPILFWIIEPFSYFFLEDIRKIIHKPKKAKHGFGKLTYNLVVDSLDVDVNLNVLLTNNSYEMFKNNLQMIINQWNKNAEVEMPNYIGFIHRVSIEKGKIDNLINVNINLGSAAEEGLRFILKEIDNLKMGILEIQIRAY